MSYTNPYGNAFQYASPYQGSSAYQPYGYQMQGQAQGMPQAGYSGRIMVQGEEGVRNYLVAPNTTVDLWDTQNPVIYQKTADANGIATVRVIDYTYRRAGTESENFVTKNEFNALAEKLDQLMAKLQGASSQGVENDK